MAQATGQGAPLTAIRKDTFEFRAAGITLESNCKSNDYPARWNEECFNQK
jgi:hypothetical protein